MCCVLAGCLGGPAASAETRNDWLVTMMGNSMRPDVTWDQIRSQMFALFYQSNPDERGVSTEGIENLRRIAMAQQRAQVMTQILAYDLNGDGMVTKDEITAVMQPRSRQMIHANGVQLEPTAQQSRQQLDRLVADAMKPDTDGDGTISTDEIRQAGQKQADIINAGWAQGGTRFVPISLDANGDGFVSAAEYEAAVREQFDVVDRDHDGRVSAAEFADFGQSLKDARQAAQREREVQLRKLRFEMAANGCDVPVAPAGTRLVVLGAVNAKALSNAWIGSEDKVTYVTTVEIAPGRDPIYLVLTSASAMLWDVVGATDRIAGVVAHSEATLDGQGDGATVLPRFANANVRAGLQGGGKPLVGVIGIPREKVRFTAHRGCLVPVTEPSMKDNSAQDMAATLLGRAPDEIGGEISAGTFRVPPLMHFKDRPVRNAMQLPKGVLGEALWREVDENFPAGVAKIDLDAVVSLHPAKRYDILPDRAGLATLTDIGALEIAGYSRGVRINDGDFKPFASPDRFKVKQKLRLPAGVAGTFILPSDVPLPEGDLGRVCLVSAADMKQIGGGRRC